MTSFERREARYQRRKAARQAKRNSYYEQFDDIREVANLKNMMKAVHRSARGVMWKPSVQRFMANDLYNATRLLRKLLNGEDVRKGFICFDVVERGKKRHIQSVHISERVCQKALSQAVLQPLLSHNLIYDNGACLIEKLRDSISGKVLKLPWKRSVTRQRRKLHKFRELYDQGKMKMMDIMNPFFSWLGYMSKKTSHRTVRSMLKLFVKLFPHCKEVMKWKPKTSMKEINLQLQN